MTPELTTDRLLLRGHTLADFDDCAALWAERAVVRYIGNQPSTREQAWSRLLRYIGHWQLLGYGFWVATERATGRFVGELGVARFERELEPAPGELEAGWVLASWAHGHGFATEGMRAVLEWIDQKFPGRRTSCVIDVGNAASLRVAAKLGYKEVGHAQYQGDQCFVLRR